MYVLGYSGFTRDSRISLGYRNPFAKTKQDFDSILSFHEGEVPFNLYPLGFFGHDASATLIHNGKIVACAAEERFNRSKFSLNLTGNTLLPKNAIQYCLKEARVSIESVDVVAHYCNFNQQTINKRIELLKPFISHKQTAVLAKSYQNIYDTMMDRNILLKQFSNMTNYCPPQYVQVKHHNAHAASTYYASGFRDAIILTIDGTGELESSILAIGHNNNIKEINRTYLPTSLGTLYLIITVFLGFKTLGDEYKVMGLAGYGNPKTYRKFFQSLINLEKNGCYSIPDFATPNFKQLLLEELGPPRKRGEPIVKKHQNIAAALQETVQNTIMHTLDYARKEIQLSKLCMAGGVALNSMLNGVISRSGLFDEIFIQPASSDEGCSLGAAYCAYYKSNPKRIRNASKIKNVYLGPFFNNKEIKTTLKKFEEKLSWQQPQNLTAIVSKEISLGKIVAWYQGKMEFGPRALGNRSILADARIPEMKDIINKKIKHRENFRPFAPAVLEEYADEYFHLNGLKNSPYMLFVVPVKSQMQAKIPAVTHVDGTARIQTVSKNTNEIFCMLLHEFKNLTGIPIILNTSFNVMNEPIVCSPKDAIRCFLNTEIDLLAIGKYLVKKRK